MDSALCQVITRRQCTRAAHDGRPVSVTKLAFLKRAGAGRGVRILTMTETAALENMLEYVVAGGTSQMKDPAFVKELKAWVLFGQAEAAGIGDGLYSGASGEPDRAALVGPSDVSPVVYG